MQGFAPLEALNPVAWTARPRILVMRPLPLHPLPPPPPQKKKKSFAAILCCEPVKSTSSQKELPFSCRSSGKFSGKLLQSSLSAPHVGRSPKTWKESPPSPTTVAEEGLGLSGSGFVMWEKEGRTKRCRHLHPNGSGSQVWKYQPRRGLHVVIHFIPSADRNLALKP